MTKKRLFVLVLCIGGFIFTQAGACEPDPPHCELVISAPVSSNANSPVKVEVTFKVWPTNYYGSDNTPAVINVQGSSGAGMSDHSECQINLLPGGTRSCVISL